MKNRYRVAGFGRPAWVTALSLSVVLLLTACATPYQPRGLGGGYLDTRVSDGTYRVEFYGNGYASRELVWNYWIYRCAELTVEKGFGFFAMAPKTVSWHDDQNGNVASMHVDLPLLSGQWRWTELKGGHAPAYIYVPGGTTTITTWSAKATVLMFRTADEPGARFALDARKVLTTLQPMMQNRGNSGLVTAEELVGKASANFGVVSGPTPPRSGDPGQAVDLDDLKELLPQ